MTRRIALAILLTVWATLVAAGVAAYATTRAVLLADLDQSLLSRASTLEEVTDEAGERFAPLTALREDDRYIVRDQVGRTVARPASAPAIRHATARIIRAAFARMPDGTRNRAITLRMPARPVQGGDPRDITLTFSGSAGHFDRLLTNLAWALLAVVAAGGAVSAVVARAVAQRALRPLRSTAEVVGTIDESSLDRRIDERNLPPELAPVASRLNEMLARLEDSLRRRRQFLADASHELRTPVAALVTALEVCLRRPRDADSYRQTLETCLADANLLRRLSEALLTQVRAEASGSAEPLPQRETVLLFDLVAEVVAAVAPLAAARSIRMIPDIEPGLRLCTQPQRLTSILLNLIGNAVQYNRDGGEVRIVGRSERPGMVVIEVSDTGIGIAPEHLPNLFDPFYRIDAARSPVPLPAAGGAQAKPAMVGANLGLGLHLVRTQVIALGGTCEVSSKPGLGTTFHLRFASDGERDQQSSVSLCEYDATPSCSSHNISDRS